MAGADGAYTFLPYGASSPPGAVRPPCAAAYVPTAVAAAVREAAHAAGCEIVRDEAVPSDAVGGGQRLILLRADGEPAVRAALATASNAGEERAAAFPVDAGPFASLDDAAATVGRWLDQFWMCSRDEQGAASCFEYGGCHKRCWWRAQAASPPTVELRLRGYSRQGEAPVALEALRRHSPAARDGCYGETAATPALQLVACFVACADGAEHFCSLRPK